MNNKFKQCVTHFFAVWLFVLVTVGTANADISGAKTVVETSFNAIFNELVPHLETDYPIDSITSDILKRELLPHLDVQKFAKLIIGKHWKKATSQQREKFIAILSEFLIRTTVKVIVSNRDTVLESADRVSIADVQQGRTEDRAIVTMLFSTPGESDKTISFRMLSDSGIWRLYDVIFEGVSFAVNYRTILNSEINKYGIEEVTANLSEKLSK